MKFEPDVATLREKFFRHVCQTSPAPLGIVVRHASKCEIAGADGRTYLDLLSGMGVANVGHNHPEVVRAVEQQLHRHLHVSVYGEMIQEAQVLLAEALARVTPGDLSVVYFTNSGAEAIEGAMKVARKFTERPRFVAFHGSFHGDTFGALSLGGNSRYREPFEPLLPVVDFLPFGELEALERIGHDVAAVFVEPIQSEGGVRIPPEDFLPALRHRCNQVGALLVCDEVLTGFGRTGKLFACSHWEVVPDLLVVAKALGGGLPLGAFIGREEVMATLSHDPPLAHVTTFGGHPLSCAAGLASLRILERENLTQRSAELGELWCRELREILGNDVREVRGRGLLIGIEFPDAESTRRFTARCLELGLIVNWTLHCDNVVRLLPPLCIEPQQLQEATRRMRQAVTAL
ncbi:MAG: aspartate aminotransferase family protein [Candidatus Binatia bacterium]|nr:MAG: aspartate aminotransferase family protein [Candidatus Binatia bacterium]